MARPYTTDGVSSLKYGNVNIWMSLDISFGEGESRPSYQTMSVPDVLGVRNEGEIE